MFDPFLNCSNTWLLYSGSVVAIVLMVTILTWLIPKHRQSIHQFLESMSSLREELEQLRAENSRLQDHLKETDKKQQEIEQQWQINYQNLPLPAYRWQWQDHDLRLVDYNQEAEKWWQEKISLKDYLGKTPDTLFSVKGQEGKTECILGLQNEVVAAIWQCFRSKQPVSVVKTTKIQEELTLSPYTCIFLPPLGVILYQTCPLHHLQVFLKQEINQQRVLVDLSLQALKIKPNFDSFKEGDIFQELLETAVEWVGETLNVPYCSILQFVASGNLLLCQATYGWDQEVVKGISVSAGADSHAGYTLLLGQPVIVEDLQKEVRFTGSELLYSHGVVSGVTVIIAGSEQPFGVLAVHSTMQRVFTATEVHFLQSIAHIISARLLLQEQQERLFLLERAINASNNGIVITSSYNPCNPIIYANEGFERITGYSKEEAIGQNCRFLHGEDREQAGLLEIRSAIREGRECSTVLRNYRKDGTMFWNELHIAPVYGTDGALTHYIGVQTDVTDRKCTEETLQLTQFCLDRARDAVLWLHSSGYFIYANDNAHQALGYTRSELLSLKADQVGIFSPPLENNSLDQKQSLTFETEHRCKDGTLVPVEISANYLEFNDQKYNCAFVRDISQRKKVEKALRASEARLRGIFQQAAVGIALLNPQGMILEVNPGACHIWGYSAEELCEKSWQDITYPEDLEQDKTLIEALLQHNIPLISKEKRYIRKDQTVIWCAVTVSGIYESLAPNALLQSLVLVVTDITERKLAESALRESEEKFRTQYKGIPVITLTWQYHNSDFVLVDYNDTAEMSSEGRVRMWVGKTVKTLFADLPSMTEDIWNCYTQRQTVRREFTHHFGRPHQVRCLYGTYVFVPPDLVMFHGEDITERKQAEFALTQSEERLDSILSSIEDVVWTMTLDRTAVMYINPAVSKVYGVQNEAFITDHQLRMNLIYQEDQDRVRRQIQKSLDQKGSYDLEYRIVRPDGELRWVRDRARYIYDELGRAVRLDGLTTDITEKKRIEEQLVHDAFHDALTGLPNRLLFMDRLGQALKRVQRTPLGFSSLGHGQAGFAVLFLDVDRFKVINDSMGHSIGDELLKQIARRLENCVRPVDTVARLGGDEFTLLLDDLQSVEMATKVAEKIIAELSFPFQLRQSEVTRSVSIGIAVGSPHYQQPEDLLRDADISMYRAKEKGRACYEVFDKAMHDQVLAHLELETDLRTAIDRQEFSVYYQPIVNLTDHCIVGFEALIRWIHPQRGFISPDQFIPIAEDTGLIVEIGEWVLETACSQVKKWQMKYPQWADLSISVNLSSRQLRVTNLIDHIDDILTMVQFDPKLLKLEITESLVMDNVERAEVLFWQFRERGIQLSMDDFGTGYSSLSYLHRFPMNILKVDRSFVSRLGENGENSEIIQAIITLAHTLGMKVIAEGIETKTQADQLLMLGCELGQGFYFSKPLNYEAMEGHLLQYKQP